MKFCRKCGSQLEDGAVFCNACGESQNTDTQAVNEVNSQTPINDIVGTPEQPVYQENPMMPPKKSKKPLIIGISIGAVVVIAAVVVGLVFLLGGGKGGSGSAEGIVKKYLNAYKDFDGEAMADCIAYSSAYKEEMEESKEELISSFSMMEGMAEIDYKMGKIEKVSSSEADEFWEDAEYNGVLVEEKDIKDLRVCEATLTIEVFGTESEEEMSIYIGKYKGDWKVLYME